MKTMGLRARSTRALACGVAGAAMLSLAPITACSSAPSAQPPAKTTAVPPVEGHAVGDRAIEFALPNAEGRLVRLSELRGKVVLIEFSAMW